MHKFSVTVSFLACLTMIVGCESARWQLPSTSVEMLSGLPYPGDKEHGPDLGIIVVRKANAIVLVNLTPRKLHDMQLWLNHEYVGLVDVIEIGNPAGRNRFLLNHFVNQYHEAFPVGRFLTPDKGSMLVLAELYNPATELRHRVRVQLDNG